LSLQSLKGEVLNEVDALLLLRISETNSLTEAAKLLGISYRNAWGRIKRVESVTGKPILKTSSGGTAGGSSTLTPEGRALYNEYKSVRKYISSVLFDRESAGNVGYKLSARNRVDAKIVQLKKGDITTLIKMTATGPVAFTSIISNEAAEDLGLQEGDDVIAVIKATEVMIAKQIQFRPDQRSRQRKG